MFWSELWFCYIVGHTAHWGQLASEFRLWQDINEHVPINSTLWFCQCSSVVRAGLHWKQWKQTFGRVMALPTGQTSELTSSLCSENGSVKPVGILRAWRRGQQVITVHSIARTHNTNWWCHVKEKTTTVVKQRLLWKELCHIFIQQVSGKKTFSCEISCAIHM